MERGKDDREDKDNLLDSLHHLLSCKRMVRTAQTIISKFERTISWAIGRTGNFFIRNFIEMARTEKRNNLLYIFASVSCSRTHLKFEL